MILLGEHALGADCKGLTSAALKCLGWIATDRDYGRAVMVRAFRKRVHYMSVGPTMVGALH